MCGVNASLGSIDGRRKEEGSARDSGTVHPESKLCIQLLTPLCHSQEEWWQLHCIHADKKALPRLVCTGHFSSLSEVVIAATIRRAGDDTARSTSC